MYQIQYRILFTVYVINRDMYIVHFDDKVKLSGQDGSFLTQACWVQNSELFPAEFIFLKSKCLFYTAQKERLTYYFGAFLDYVYALLHIFNHTILA